MDYKEVAVRALKTFGQAFLAQLALSAADLLHAPSLSVVEKLLFAAAVAAGSVVWNTVLLPAWQGSHAQVKAFLSR